MEFKIRVDVTRKEGILDPEGDAIRNGLNQGLGLKEVTRVGANRFFSLTIDTTNKKEALRIAEDAAKRLLANPVYQDYCVTFLNSNNKFTFILNWITLTFNKIYPLIQP